MKNAVANFIRCKEGNMEKKRMYDGDAFFESEFLWLTTACSALLLVGAAIMLIIIGFCL